MDNEAQVQAGEGAAELDELSEFSDILKQTIKPRRRRRRPMNLRR